MAYQQNILESSSIPNDLLIDKHIIDRLKDIDDLNFFLKTAPINWKPNQVIRRYYLNSELGFVSCVHWNRLFYMTGTDIVKVCMYLIEQFGRKIVHRKKFEEGIFSELRNLKCGIDATLEQPKSKFLSFLFQNFCLKTQKKQKIFFWFSVPHTKLFLDALEKDLKREQCQQQAATEAVREPALSFKLNLASELSVSEQLTSYLELLKTNEIHDGTTPEQEEFQENVTRMQSMIKNEIERITEAGSRMDTNNQAHLPIQVPSPINPGQIIPQTLVLESDTELDANNEKENKDREETDSNAFLGDNPGIFEDPVVTGTSTKTNDTTKNVVEEDFPLDYFPVTVEYPMSQPRQTVETGIPSPSNNAAVVPVSNPPDTAVSDNLSGFADNAFGAFHEEEEVMQENRPHYLAEQPYSDLALLGTTPHVMTNREYYNLVRQRPQHMNLNLGSVNRGGYVNGQEDRSEWATSNSPRGKSSGNFEKDKMEQVDGSMFPYHPQQQGYDFPYRYPGPSSNTGTSVNYNAGRNSNNQLQDFGGDPNGINSDVFFDHRYDMNVADGKYYPVHEDPNTWATMIQSQPLTRSQYALRYYNNGQSSTTPVTSFNPYLTSPWFPQHSASQLYGISPQRHNMMSPQRSARIPSNPDSNYRSPSPMYASSIRTTVKQRPISSKKTRPLKTGRTQSQAPKPISLKDSEYDRSYIVKRVEQQMEPQQQQQQRPNRQKGSRKTKKGDVNRFSNPDDDANLCFRKSQQPH
ncbi:homeodomain family transcription factor STE12 KNAG_0B04450 [Huiozyma naganishii CBS 8797]|uniref:Transcription factor n=1 Tax=Huiozyma naganishii (strain ATCC MYA-139 / BCRC 22969 / CBS 8797 / KCTC 17520 / NBRC 10181 / NCYC 3082 / Yp74L-3) TaxID=1071383 RepID=J7S3S5_HUIN7|nr:hypothetical protein KNAG_0B04450 [Kazachstania naganishii CBS 8797]CCK68879.1 hypothetical protein KNAG_0B04450 [Kazachstania naganishii CBS 8797]